MKPHRPECFGNLEEVFPMQGDGLRHSPERCLACGEKTSCLKAAINGGSREVMAEEKLQREWDSGRISFLERWSRKKALHNRRVKKP